MLQRATVTVLLLTTALVGCSSSVTGKPTAAQTGSASQSMTEDSPATSQAADTSADIPAPGTGKVTIDGTVLKAGPARCYSSSNALVYGSQGGVSVEMDSPTSLKVNSVYIITEGFEMGFHDGHLEGHATATRAGDTFRVEGEGTGNYNGGSNRTMKFTITLTCPTGTGF